MRVIGFAGRKRSGKSCLARYICEHHHAKRVVVADSLKYMMCLILGVTYDELNRMKDDGQPHPYKVTDEWIRTISQMTGVDTATIESEMPVGREFADVREILQFVGTDLIRKHCPTWHVDMMRKRIGENLRHGYSVVVDDVRFPNEAEAIRELGGDVYFIVRADLTEFSGHLSENSLHWRDFDNRHVILNDGIDGDDFASVVGNSFGDMLAGEYHLDETDVLKYRRSYNADLHSVIEGTMPLDSNPLIFEDLKSLSL